MSGPIAAAIIMGKSGVGKTSFYNKLCETDHLATYSSKSLTRQLFRSEVVHGGNRFTLIDTPGTDSKDEVFKHSFLLKEALTSEAINAIFVLIQFNDRCDSALEEFDKTISYLKPQYRDMVVVIISKFDMAPPEHSDNIKVDYAKAFADEGFTRIMFHSKEMAATDVAAKMLGFMNSMPKKQMQYEEAEFLQHFRVADESRAQKKVVDKSVKDVNEILQSYKRMLQELGNPTEKDDIILSAIASSRYEVDEIYDKFTKEFGERMIDLDCYTNSISLQKAIEHAHREFRDDVKEFMSYNPDDTTDWKNCIRKCKFCGEIWVKVSGCEGSTTCGNRESTKDVSSKPWVQYLFNSDASGKRSWMKNCQSAAKADEPTNTSAKRSRVWSAKGCGKAIVWKDQPRLTAQELAKCLEVKGVENLILSMQNKPEFQKAMAGYVRTIDATFTK